MKFVGLVINILLLLELDFHGNLSYQFSHVRKKHKFAKKRKKREMLALVPLLSCLNSYPARFDVL